MSNNSQALGAYHPTPSVRSVAVTPAEWECMKDQSRMFIAAGCLPSNISKPEQAMVIILKGRELGVPPMASLASVFLIKGTPAVSADLMKALCFRDLPGFEFEILAKTDTLAKVQARRHAGNKWEEFTFTIEDAKRAQLVRRDSNWEKYPQRMLLHRATAFACRTIAPDVVFGCYTPDEAEEMRDVTPPSDKAAPPAPPDYLPGVEPRCTAEQYVETLAPAGGGTTAILNQVLKYRHSGMPDGEKYAKQIETALDAYAGRPGAPQAEKTIPDDERLPFERESP